MKSTITLAIAALTTGLALGATAQTRSGVPESEGRIVTAEGPRVAPEQTKSADDIDFLVEALRTDLAVVKMGDLATQRGHDKRVRDYGARLKSEHARQAGELERLLEPLDVTIPMEPTADALAHYTVLSRLSGSEFDAAFVETMVASHMEAIEQYGAQTHANPDRALHDFAANGIQMLREHLAAAEALR
jgi:putative membrane protein